MKDLQIKIKELESEISELENRIIEINRICKVCACQNKYYDEFAEIYAELNRLQIELNVLKESQDVVVLWYCK